MNPAKRSDYAPINRDIEPVNVLVPRSRYTPKDYGVDPEGKDGIFGAVRVNQKFEDTAPVINCIRDAFFAFMCPVSFCCAIRTVRPMQDTIVSRCGVVSEILRIPGPYCINPLCVDFTDVYMGLKDIEILDMSANDSHGSPLKVSAQFVYRVTDSVQATYCAENMKKYLKDQAESALRAILSQHAFDSQDPNAKCLIKHDYAFDDQLQNSLQEIVNFAGIKIEAFRLINIGYEPKMEKLLLAKQEAQAEVTARTAIADGTAGIIEEMVTRLKGLGIHFTEEELRQVAKNLMLIIINHGHTSLILNQGTPPLQPQMYLPNLDPVPASPSHK